MLKTFTSDLRRNLTKILCLTVGMSIGMILIAKIYYEETYDSFFPDADRIYMVCEIFNDPENPYDFDQTSGAYAPALKRYLTQVEEATRFTWFSNGNIVFDDNRIFESNGIKAADSCLFDLFSNKIIAGDPHEVLSVKHSCMIPKSLADKIGNDVVGLQFSIPNFSPEYKAVIGGIYEDFPENSSIPNSIYISLNTFEALGWSGTENWVGNDAYKSFVKLHKDIKPEDLRHGIRKMLEDNVDEEVLEKRYFDIGLKSLRNYHSSESSVKEMVLMLSVLAVLILLCASVNYLLIVVGQISSRSKAMAIRKCFGTGNGKLFFMVLGESFCYILISFLLAVVMVYALGDLCKELLGLSPKQLFSTNYVWVAEGFIVLILLLITGVIPGIIYCKTPVARAFKGDPNKKKMWKLSLLSLQFIVSGFLFCLLLLIARQYNMVTNFDVGYNYDNVGMVSMGSFKGNSNKLKEELKRLGCVENVAGATQNFVSQSSGGEITIEEDETNKLQIADLLWTDRDIFEVLGLKFLQGSTFTENADTTLHEVVVEERMIDALRTQYGVDDPNIIGRTFKFNGHGEPQEYTICGVVNNFHRGGFEEKNIDRRPGIFFPPENDSWTLYIRFTELNPENIHKAQEVINSLIVDPNAEVYITPYKNQFERYTYDIKKFATAVMVVGIAILLIALSGLLGYVSDEVETRSKEIAIRKVSGTSEYKILKLFCRDIAIIAIPSLIVGGIIAMIVGKDWLSRFCNQVSLSPIISVACVIILLLLILSMVVFNSLKIARSNPVEYLRNE